MTARRPREVAPDDLRARFEWKKVEAPKAWRPKHNGEELVGYYRGRTVRSGRFGQYEVVMLLVPGRGAFMLSGTRIIQLIDAAGVDEGWPVRVVWKGLKNIGETEDGEPKRMKDFEVFVAEGEPIDVDDLPDIKE